MSHLCFSEYVLQTPGNVKKVEIFKFSTFALLWLLLITLMWRLTFSIEVTLSNVARDVKTSLIIDGYHIHCTLSFSFCALDFVVCFLTLFYLLFYLGEGIQHKETKIVTV